MRSNPLKQKAVLIHERLNEAKSKKVELESSIGSNSEESASQEKARLLAKVKEDNVEISGMEKRIKELEETCQKVKDQMLQLDSEIESGARKIMVFNCSRKKCKIRGIIEKR